MGLSSLAVEKTIATAENSGVLQQLLSALQGNRESATNTSFDQSMNIVGKINLTSNASTREIENALVGALRTAFYTK
jgi:hypothetical protein